MEGMDLSRTKGKPESRRRAPEQPPSRSSVAPVGRGLKGEHQDLNDIDDAEDDGQGPNVHDLDVPRSRHGVSLRPWMESSASALG